MSSVKIDCHNQGKRAESGFSFNKKLTKTQTHKSKRYYFLFKQNTTE